MNQKIPSTCWLEANPDGAAIALRVKKHPRARRISLRHDALRQEMILTLPRRASLEAGMRFAESKRGWMEKTLRNAQAAISFTEGAMIPLLGIEYKLCFTGTLRGLVTIKEGALYVPGASEHVTRRLTDWLKLRLRQEATRMVHAKAVELGKRIGRVSVREMRSRWGSCHSSGRMSFSWRLIFAPAFVLDYVASHEAAHLVHMHHGPRFWQIVEQLCPQWRKAYAWLKENGQSLYRYGARYSG